MELLISIKSYRRGNQGGPFRVPGKSEKMDEPEIQIEVIQAEIRESIERAKALVAESDRLVRDPVIDPPQVEA